MVDDQVTIRPATLEDVPELVRLRRMMFESMGCEDQARLDRADVWAESYFQTAIPAGTFHGWLATTSTDEVVGSGGVVIDQHPPGPSNRSGQVGYVMNVVTIPRYRRRGIARRMMETLLNWLAEQGIEMVSLHTSEAGRPLYRQLGFVDSNEMVLRIE
jgi:ribosomal protein S18 acetylase RimI-like enzyme